MINWRDNTPPDHLHPKFKLLLEDFKKGILLNPPSITYKDPDDPNIELPEEDN